MKTAPLHYRLEWYIAKSGKRWRAVVPLPGSRRKTTSWRALQREAKADGEQLLKTLAGPETSQETVAELLERWIRDLTLPAFAVAVLVAAYQQARICGSGDRRLFTMKPDQLTHGLRATLQRRGLNPVRFHMLRHAVASTMLASGASMLEVQAQLGHADSVTTLGTYGHLLPGALSAAAQRYGLAWEKANGKLVDSAAHQIDTELDNIVDMNLARARKKPA